jgi:hypothetical protein
VSGEGGEEDRGVDWVLWGGGWVLEESKSVVILFLKECGMEPFYTLLPVSEQISLACSATLYGAMVKKVLILARTLKTEISEQEL